MELPFRGQYRNNSPKTEEELKQELEWTSVMPPPSEEFPPEEIRKTLKQLNLDTDDERATD